MSALENRSHNMLSPTKQPEYECISVYLHFFVLSLSFHLLCPVFGCAILCPYFSFLHSFSFICPTSCSKAQGWNQTSVYVCVCRECSCVTLHCWEATGSLNAVWIWAGRVTACKHPSSLAFPLSTSPSLFCTYTNTHTHRLTERKWPAGPGLKRCERSHLALRSFEGCSRGPATHLQQQFSKQPQSCSR